jgi:hypothetical protein
MPSAALLTPRRRDALIALLALALLAGPLWVPALHLDDPTYRYERARVTAGDAGVSFANASAVPAGTVASDEIACAGYSSRACAFERHLARGHTVLTGIYSSHPGERTDPFAVAPDRYDYEYVQIEGTVYEPTTVANDSRVYVVANGTVYEAGESPAGADTSGDLYRNELSLRPVSPAEALADVARDPGAVPGPIRRAATTGAGVAHRDLEVPHTPIRTADGRYYRVYLASQRQPPGDRGWIETLLRAGTPIAGLFVLSRLRDRVAISYTGATGRDESRRRG